jgi:hypothetical protein
MRLDHAEEGGQAGPQVVKCGFPGQPIAERGHPLTDLSVSTPEPVLAQTVSRCRGGALTDYGDP